MASIWRVGGGATNTPLFRRSLLNPRRPLSSIDPSIDRLYVPYSSLPAPSSDITATTLISRIYHLEATQISALQTLATKSTNQKPPSKLQTLSAYLWKLLAQSDTVLEKSTCKLGIVVDGRRYIGPTMASYFRNVISIPFAQMGVCELEKLLLADVVEVVGQIVATAANEEHFMNLVDWVEAHRPELFVAKAYVDGSEFEPSFVVSSGQRFPVTEVDFEWGKPVFGLYHFPWGGSTGYVMPMPSPNGNGDLIVYMHFSESQLDFIKDKASHVFKSFSIDFVKAFTN